MGSEQNQVDLIGVKVKSITRIFLITRNSRITGFPAQGAYPMSRVSALVLRTNVPEPRASSFSALVEQFRFGDHQIFVLCTNLPIAVMRPQQPDEATQH